MTILQHGDLGLLHELMNRTLINIHLHLNNQLTEDPKRVLVLDNFLKCIVGGGVRLLSVEQQMPGL